ncbi:hypothetical protein BAE44_0010900 [Dichanthelium oligosanthes]|uniref:KIB1-4 beta-propeller domain-containing protein n=1 Tax=Dichanthelium oligosanthes TaxID=888268 RepID=A0A1E5VSK4_9POAL|nr:hypothetical protein BAE44_0010900 [Dichanthelium oligosanthes]
MEYSKPTDDLGSLAAAAASFPLLVYDHGEQPDNSQTVLSVADGSLRTYHVPEMRNFRCLETPQGLVLMVDTSSLQARLWNPQTGEKMPLPAMDEELPPYCRCLVSDTSSSPPDWASDGVELPDSLVLVYDLTRPELLICRIRGGTAWVRQSYDAGLYEVPGKAPTERAARCMAAVQGIFYFHKAPGVVGAFCCFADDPEPCLKLATLDAPDPTIVSDAPQIVTLSYLLECSKDLFRVCIFFLGCSFERIEEVGAYMMDFTKKEWIKVTDIGDRAFLLGPSSFAASCSAAEHGLKKGSVYFANDFLGHSNEFHIFDLKEGTREHGNFQVQ